MSDAVDSRGGRHRKPRQPLWDRTPTVDLKTVTQSLGLLQSILALISQIDIVPGQHGDPATWARFTVLTLTVRVLSTLLRRSSRRSNN